MHSCPHSTWPANDAQHPRDAGLGPILLRTIARLATGIKRFKLPRTGRGLAWAPDGQSLLYVTWSGQVVRIKANGGAFVSACMRFLRTRATQEGGDKGGLPLSPEVVQTFLKVLQGASQGMPPDLQAELRQLITQIQNSPNKDRDMSTENLAAQAGTAQGFSADVEEEANRYFQRVYSMQQSIGELVEVLRNFRASQV